MAIKVGGTTVIDDSRALNNITSVDATTVAALGTAGVGGGGGSVDLVAATALTAGDVVVVDTSTGKANKPTVSDTLGQFEDSETVNPNVGTAYFKDIYYQADLGYALWAVQYDFNGSNYRMYGIKDGTLDFYQSNIASYNFGVRHTHMAYDPVQKTGVFIYYNGADRYRTGQLQSNGYMNFSNEQSLPFNLGNDPLMASTYDPDTGKIIVIWKDSTDSDKTKYVVGTASGNSVSWGTPGTVSTLEAKDNTYLPTIAVTYDETANRVLVAFVATTSYIQIIAGAVSGNSITWGSTVLENTYSSYGTALAYDPSSGKNLLVWGSDSAEFQIYSVLTLSGSTVSKGTVGSIGNRYARYNSVIYNPDTQGLLVATSDSNNGGVLRAGSISGTTFTVSDTKTYESGDSDAVEMTYNTNLSQVYVSHTDSQQSDKPMVQVASAASSNASDFIGIAAESISQGATGKITVAGGLNENVTGLTTNTKYSVSVGGSLVTADTGTVAGRALASNKLLVTGTGL